MQMVYYPDERPPRQLKNSLAYMQRATQGSYPSPYLTHVLVAKDIDVDPAYCGAHVVYCLSDGRVVVGYWQSFRVLVDYFTHRSYKHKGVPLVHLN